MSLFSIGVPHGRCAGILACAVATILGCMACGGDSSGSGACSAEAGCGGDLVGTWKGSAMCAQVDLVKNLMVTGGSSECTQVFANAGHSVQYDASATTVEFTSAGSYSFSGEAIARFTFDFPPSCLKRPATSDLCNQLTDGL